MFTEPQKSLDMFGDSVLTTKKIVWKQSEWKGLIESIDEDNQTGKGKEEMWVLILTEDEKFSCIIWFFLAVVFFHLE